MQWRDLRACQTCLFLTANGECDPDDVAEIAGYQRWHADHPEWHLALGGEHRDTCTEVDRNAGCDCDDLGFSWRSCDVCGVNLGGDRYQLTAFRKDNK